MAAAKTAPTEADIPLERLAKAKQLTVAGHDVFVGPLSIDQWMDLSRAVIATVTKFPPGTIDKLNKMIQASSTGGDDLPDFKVLMPVLMSVLDGDSVRGLLAAITAVPAEDLRTATMVEFLDVVEAVKETGELRSILASFKRVVEGW